MQPRAQALGEAALFANLFRRLSMLRARDLPSKLRNLISSATRGELATYWTFGNAYSEIKIAAKRGQPLQLVQGDETYVVSTMDTGGIAPGVLAYGHFQLDVLTRAVNLALNGSGKILIDVGANIGTTCIPALTRGFFEQAIAVEPDQLNFRLLSANVALNGLTHKVDLFNLALSDVSGSVRLRSHDSNLGMHHVVSSFAQDWSKLPGSEAGNIAVPSITLDDLVVRAGITLNPKSDLIWMDIEGYEGITLRGSALTNLLSIPLVLEVNPAMLVRNMTLSEFTAILPRYNVFSDLRDDSNRVHDIRSFPRFLRTLEETDSSTDVLFMV